MCHFICAHISLCGKHLEKHLGKVNAIKQHEFVDKQINKTTTIREAQEKLSRNKMPWKTFPKWKQQTMADKTNTRDIMLVSHQSIRLSFRFVSFLNNFSVSLKIELQFLSKAIIFMILKCKTLTHGIHWNMPCSMLYACLWIVLFVSGMGH